MKMLTGWCAASTIYHSCYVHMLLIRTKHKVQLRFMRKTVLRSVTIKNICEISGQIIQLTSSHQKTWWYILSIYLEGFSAPSITDVNTQSASPPLIQVIQENKTKSYYGATCRHICMCIHHHSNVISFKSISHELIMFNTWCWTDLHFLLSFETDIGLGGVKKYQKGWPKWWKGILRVTLLT